VAAGGSVLDPRVVERLVAHRAAAERSPLRRLTERERQVLAQMAQGRNNRGHRPALGLGDRAVEKHINALFSKLGLSEEPDVHRRVMAVLTFLDDQPPPGAGRAPGGLRRRAGPDEPGG
jgi:DNA-binding NarL/FixJ family response regulator